MSRAERQHGSGVKQSITSIEIKENTESLAAYAHAMFTGSKTMKEKYGLSGDTHMMKNIEWGAVAYLTESKYGRNGTGVSISDNNYITGGGDYIANKLQSSTGNEYGIYDLNGGYYDVVAAYIENKSLKSVGYNTSFLAETDMKYKDIYEVGEPDSRDNNYQVNKGIKGDAVYETSTTVSTKCYDWHGNSCYFPSLREHLFARGEYYRSPAESKGVFSFNCQSFPAIGAFGFRVVLIS